MIIAFHYLPRGKAAERAKLSRAVADGELFNDLRSAIDFKRDQSPRPAPDPGLVTARLRVINPDKIMRIIRVPRSLNSLIESAGARRSKWRSKRPGALCASRRNGNPIALEAHAPAARYAAYYASLLPRAREPRAPGETAAHITDWLLLSGVYIYV